MRYWIIRCPMAILAVGVAAWAGPNLSADVSGGYRPLDQRTMESARGSNPYYEDLGIMNDDCSTFNRQGNQLGSLQCSYKDGTTTYVHYRRACVVCSASVPAWPRAVKLKSPTASDPLQASTDPAEMNQSCGDKTVGKCDLTGNCGDPQPNPNQPKCATNVTQSVPQPVASPPTSPGSGS